MKIATEWTQTNMCNIWREMPKKIDTKRGWGARAMEQMAKYQGGNVNLMAGINYAFTWAFNDISTKSTFSISNIYCYDRINYVLIFGLSLPRETSFDSN